MSKLNFAIQIGSCKHFYLKWLNSPAASGSAAWLDFNVEKRSSWVVFFIIIRSANEQIKFHLRISTRFFSSRYFECCILMCCVRYFIENVDQAWRWINYLKSAHEKDCYFVWSVDTIRNDACLVSFLYITCVYMCDMWGALSFSCSTGN